MRDGHGRQTHRPARRLVVRYGASDVMRTGYTRNVSTTGLFLQTGAAFVPGTLLRIEVELPDRVLEMRAKVAWAKAGTNRLAHVMKSGMGLALIDPPGEWAAFVNALTT